MEARATHLPKKSRSLGGPKISLFFSPLPPQFLFFSPSLLVLFVEFWWCLKRRGPEMCTFGLSGCRVKPRRPHQTGPAGLAHDSPRTPNVHISGPRRFKHHQNSTKKTKREEKRIKNCGGRGKKKREILGPHPSGHHSSGPHPSGPHNFGPSLFWVWPPPFGAPPFGAPPFGLRGPTISGPTLCLGVAPHPLGPHHDTKQMDWPKLDWPQLALAKIGRAKTTMAKNGLAKIGLAKIGLAKIGQIRMAKTGLAKVGPFRGGSLPTQKRNLYRKENSLSGSGRVGIQLRARVWVWKTAQRFYGDGPHPARDNSAK